MSCVNPDDCKKRRSPGDAKEHEANRICSVMSTQTSICDCCCHKVHCTPNSACCLDVVTGNADTELPSRAPRLMRNAIVDFTAVPVVKEEAKEQPVEAEEPGDNDIPPNGKTSPGLEGSFVDFDLLRKESERLKTFDKWPSTKVRPSDLAAAGFFHLGRNDRVQCAFCRGVVGNWTEVDCPLVEHARHFPLCPFILDADCGNERLPETLDFRVAYSLPERPRQSKPKFPLYSDIKDRLHSFDYCPTTCRIRSSVPQLAAAGFFYAGAEDNVVCFCCSGRLNGWKFTSNPWEEHAKKFPRCVFVESRKRTPNGEKEYHLPVVTPIKFITKPHVIEGACDVFQNSLVKKVVEYHEKEFGTGFQEAEDLCWKVFQMYVGGHIHT